MASEQEFKQLYQALSPVERTLYLKSYQEVIAPVEKGISKEDKNQLCIYLIRRMKKSRKQR